MEQDTYYITVVDGDEKKKNTTEAGGGERKAKSNVVPRHKVRTKRRKTLKVSNVEKRILAKLVEQHPCLWDKNHELHCNNHALLSAWSRISREMPGRNGIHCFKLFVIRNLN